MDYVPLRILFLSDEKSHTDIFLHVIEELKSIANGDVESQIVDTRSLNVKPPSLLVPYKREIQRIEQIIEKFQPSVLVVANDQGEESTFIRICRLRGIPSLAVQDGILIEKKSKGLFGLLKWRNYLLWRMISGVLYTNVISRLFIRLGRQIAIPCWGTSGADKIAVMGDYYRGVFVSRGVRRDKIVVTGYPLLDNVPIYVSGFSVKKFFRKMGLQMYKPLILLITQPFVEDGIWSPSLRDEFVKSVINAVPHVNGQLIIKPHPRENLGVYKILVGNHRDIRVINKDSNLHELLLASDVVMTVGSTVGLWALAYKKSLLVLTCFPCATENPLEDMAISVKKVHELPETLKRILQDEKLKANLSDKTWKTLHDHIYRLDGKASERIARLIIQLNET